MITDWLQKHMSTCGPPVGDQTVKLVATFFSITTNISYSFSPSSLTFMTVSSSWLSQTITNCLQPRASSFFWSHTTLLWLMLGLKKLLLMQWRMKDAFRRAAGNDVREARGCEEESRMGSTDQWGQELQRPVRCRKASVVLNLSEGGQQFRNLHWTITKAAEPKLWRMTTTVCLNRWSALCLLDMKSVCLFFVNAYNKFVLFYCRFILRLSLTLIEIWTIKKTS